MPRGGSGVAPDRRTAAMKLSLSFVLMVVLLLSLVSNVAMNANAQNSTTSSGGTGASSSSSSSSSSSNSADTGSQTGEQVGNNTVSDSSSQDLSDATASDSALVGNMTQTSGEETGNSTSATTDTNSTSTESEPEETISPLADLTETSSNNSLVRISGEQLVQSNSSITRSVTFPTLTFQGMADSQVTMTMTWNTDGSTEVKDSRGYRYVLSVPASEGAFSLWQNSTVVDQRISGTDKQYDIFWKPVQNSGGYADRYEFFIAGKSVNATTIKVAVDDGKNSIVRDNKLQVIRPMNQSKVGSSDDGLSYDLQNSTNVAFDNNNEYEPEGLELDWSDAIKSGYQVDFDSQTSILTIPIGGGEPFLIDPYVVGGTNTFISPEIGNYFEGQTRIVSTNNTRLNAFYYDSSNIVYRTSDDKGHTWSSAISLGTGTVASDKHRWTVLHYIKDGQEHVNVIYMHVVGSDTVFYSKAGTVTSPDADIDWDSPVEIDNTTVNSGCISASGSCVAVAAAADTNGTVYAAFRFVSSGATHFSYEIMRSTDGGGDWEASLPEVGGISIFRPAITITSLDGGNMLFAYSKYDSADLYYRVFNGTSWSSVRTITGTGMATSTFKQLSSAAADNSHQAAYIAYTNVTSTGGILKVAKFAVNGTFLSAETADSTLRHNLPSIFARANGDLVMLSVANGKVYETRKDDGVWQIPFNPFGTSFTSLDQLSGATVMDDTVAALWRESTGSPYNVRFDLIENRIIAKNVAAQNSPLKDDYFAGERRVFASSGNVLFAFYYNGSQILYKTSTDIGNTWSISPTSTGTGTLNPNNSTSYYRWTIVHSTYNGTELATILYYKNATADTDFYAKTFEVNGRTLTLKSTVGLDSAGSVPSCGHSNGCEATMTGAVSSTGTLFAAFTFTNFSNDNWYMWIMKSINGGQSWSLSASFGPTVHATGNLPITLTPLDSGKMLLAYGSLDSSSLSYLIYNGTTWSGTNTLSSIGWSISTEKQISSVTVHDTRVNATNPTLAYVAYLTGGDTGTLKVAVFYGNGTFKGTETADSTLSHQLPALSANSDGILRAYSLSGNAIYLTLRNATGWFSPQAPYASFVGESPDQLTSLLDGTFQTGVMWANGTAGDYTLHYDGTSLKLFTQTGENLVKPSRVSQIEYHGSQEFGVRADIATTDPTFGTGPAWWWAKAFAFEGVLATDSVASGALASGYMKYQELNTGVPHYAEAYYYYNLHDRTQYWIISNAGPVHSPQTYTVQYNATSGDSGCWNLFISQLPDPLEQCVKGMVTGHPRFTVMTSNSTTTAPASFINMKFFDGSMWQSIEDFNGIAECETLPYIQESSNNATLKIDTLASQNTCTNPTEVVNVPG
jgi:cytoskeletal protein RodZ